MAWIRCVLPSPTPPYTNSGLYDVGWSATCNPAARASWFAFPATNVLNVNVGLRLPGSTRRAGFVPSGVATAAAGAGVLAAANPLLVEGTGAAGTGLTCAGAGSLAALACRVAAASATANSTATDAPVA